MSGNWPIPYLDSLLPFAHFARLTVCQCLSIGQRQRARPQQSLRIHTKKWALRFLDQHTRRACVAIVHGATKENNFARREERGVVLNRVLPSGKRRSIRQPSRTCRAAGASPYGSTMKRSTVMRSSSQKNKTFAVKRTAFALASRRSHGASTVGDKLKVRHQRS